MIRVPTPLIEVVRELFRLHRQGRTKAVLEGIGKLVAAIDSETDVDIDSVAKTISKLTERLDRLESRRASEEAAVQSALAKRLGISDKAIQKHRQRGKESFAQWSRDRDPDSIAWTWTGTGGRGQPLQFVPAN